MKRTAAAIVLATTLLFAGLSCSSDAPRAQRGEASVKRPNVVLVVMDEFPGDSLLDRHRRIDPVRYPNFAALASDATWFRNAYSVYDSTTKAVPLILDGMRPRPGHVGRPQRPPALDLRHVRPPRLPRRRLGGGVGALPAVDLQGRAHERGRRSSRTCSAAGRSASTAGCARSRPAGRRSGSSTCCCRTAPTSTSRRASGRGPGRRDPLHGMNTVPGFHDEFLTRHNEQRYLLQLGFADRLLGRLLRQLKRAGHLRRHDGRRHRRPRDRVPGGRADAPQRQPVERRGADADPAASSSAPASSAAGSATSTRARSTSPRRSRTCSAGGSATAPTGTRPSARSRARRHSVIAHDARLLLRSVHISGKRWEARRRAVVRRRLRQFGSGELASLFTGIGPHRELIGRPAPTAARASVRAAVAQPGLFADVEPRIGGGADADRGRPERRASGRQARPRRGRERPHRGGRALVLPRRQTAPSTSP